MGLTPEAYGRMLKHLLPPGKLWILTPDSWLSKWLTAIGDELVRASDRATDLLAESLPDTATEMVPDWERVLGLPDERVTEIPGTTAERRLAITQKFISKGGQNPAFFIALAAACGYTVTLSKFGGEVLRVGFRVSDRVYGDDYAYSFLVTVTAVAATALPEADFERVIRAATHSHIAVGFEYPP